MSAELLRQAAEAERDEWGGDDTRRTYPKSSDVHLALADWLDDEAGRVDMATDAGQDSRIYEPALRVAELILAGAS